MTLLCRWMQRRLFLEYFLMRTRFFNKKKTKNKNRQKIYSWKSIFSSGEDLKEHPSFFPINYFKLNQVTSVWGCRRHPTVSTTESEIKDAVVRGPGNWKKESGLCSLSNQNKLKGVFLRRRPIGHRWLQSPSLLNQNMAAGRLMKMEKSTKWSMLVHLKRKRHPLVIRTLDTSTEC